MKKIFIIGGMGAGKSSARKVLTDKGLPYIDLDKVGHEILLWDTVKDDLVEEFGSEILGQDGEIDRKLLAKKAFVDTSETRKLNRLTQPRIEEKYLQMCSELEAAGHNTVVVEYSVFKDKLTSLAYDADVVLAVVAPIEVRMQRAIASGFSEEDVKNRIAQQLNDTERICAADFVFENDGTKDELRTQIEAWWDTYKQENNL